jgi:hypothetical protein
MESKKERGDVSEIGTRSSRRKVPSSKRQQCQEVPPIGPLPVGGHGATATHVYDEHASSANYYYPNGEKS